MPHQLPLVLRAPAALRVVRLLQGAWILEEDLRGSMCGYTRSGLGKQ